MNHAKIVKEIFPITKDDIINDYNKLEQLNCNQIKNMGMSRIGTNTTDYFTAIERLDTKVKTGRSFFEWLKLRPELLKKKYIINMIKYYEKKGIKLDYKIWWRLFNLFEGSINQFKAIIAMNIYCRFKPTSILDFTMGWGGRLVGACALNIPKYTGIELNKNLKQPYTEMVSFLKQYTSTKIKLYFKDALKVDYSKIDYDLVLTSPPYYNLEIYKNVKKMTKDEWDTIFYKPLFSKTYEHLKLGGYYCLNVPDEVYKRVCLSLFGKATHQILLPKAKRFAGSTYKEYIYVWHKMI